MGLNYQEHGSTVPWNNAFPDDEQVPSRTYVASSLTNAAISGGPLFKGPLLDNHPMMAILPPIEVKAQTCSGAQFRN